MPAEPPPLTIERIQELVQQDIDEINVIAAKVKDLNSLIAIVSADYLVTTNPDFQEAAADVTLAYRHCEDAVSRLGKVIEALTVQPVE